MMEFQLSYFKSWRWCCESFALNVTANLENSAVAKGLEKVSVHFNSEQRQCKRMLKLRHNCTYQSMGSLRVGHDWATSLPLFTFMHWRRKWQPTPVFLPGEFQDREVWWAAIYGVAQSWTGLKWLSSSSKCEMSAVFTVVWVFFGIAFLWDWNENWPFPVLWPLLSFPNLLAYWVQHINSIIF